MSSFVKSIAINVKSFHFHHLQRTKLPLLFHRLKSLGPQGKQPPTNPQVALSLTDITFRYWTWDLIEFFFLKKLIPVLCYFHSPSSLEFSQRYLRTYECSQFLRRWIRLVLGTIDQSLCYPENEDIINDRQYRFRYGIKNSWANCHRTRYPLNFTSW